MRTGDRVHPGDAVGSEGARATGVIFVYQVTSLVHGPLAPPSPERAQTRCPFGRRGIRRGRWGGERSACRGRAGGGGLFRVGSVRTPSARLLGRTDPWTVSWACTVRWEVSSMVSRCRSWRFPHLAMPDGHEDPTNPMSSACAQTSRTRLCCRTRRRTVLPVPTPAPSSATAFLSGADERAGTGTEASAVNGHMVRRTAVLAHGRRRRPGHAL